MARASITVSAQLQPWVVPYVELMARMGLGEAAATAVVAFVSDHGVVCRTR